MQVGGFRDGFLCCIPEIIYKIRIDFIKLQGSEVQGFKGFASNRLSSTSYIRAKLMSRGARHRLVAGFSPLLTVTASDLFLLLSNL